MTDHDPHDPNRNVHIWNVSLERAERVWQELEAHRNREFGDDELRERLLRLGMPRTMEPGDELKMVVVKRVQSNGLGRLLQ